MFLLNKNKFINNFLPPRLRTNKQIAWIKVLVWHVFELWNELYLLYILIVQDLTNTIATDVFQTRLRNLYPDVGSYKCFVLNQYDDIPVAYTQFIGGHLDNDYDYFLGEAQPPVYELFLQERIKDYDYKIIIPMAYLGNQQAIISLCNKYKPAGKRYLLKFTNII